MITTFGSLYCRFVFFSVVHARIFLVLQRARLCLNFGGCSNTWLSVYTHCTRIRHTAAERILYNTHEQRALAHVLHQRTVCTYMTTSAGVRTGREKISCPAGNTLSAIVPVEKKGFPWFAGCYTARGPTSGRNTRYTRLERLERYWHHESRDRESRARCVRGGAPRDLRAERASETDDTVTLYTRTRARGYTYGRGEWAPRRLYIYILT